MEDFAGHSVLHDSDSVEGCAADVVLRLCLRCVGDFPVFLSELQVGLFSIEWLCSFLMASFVSVCI